MSNKGINALRRYTTKITEAPVKVYELSTQTLIHTLKEYPLVSALTAYAFYSWGRSAYTVAKGWWMRILGYVIHKPPEEYEFGDISSAALAASSASIAKTSAALQSLIGKSWDEYKFGDLTVATMREIPKIIRRQRRARSEAGLDAIMSSFFTQCAVLSARCVERGAISVEALEDCEPPLQLGITAAVLFYALVRSLEDDTAATDDSVVLATGMEVTGDGVPKSLADLHAGLIQIKGEIRELALSSDERDLVCTRLLCDWDNDVPRSPRSPKRSSISIGGRNLMRSLTSGGDEYGEVRVEVSDRIAAKMRVFAEHLRAHLGPDVFDENMQDVLIAVAEKQFGTFQCDWISDNVLPGTGAL